MLPLQLPPRQLLLAVLSVSLSPLPPHPKQQRQPRQRAAWHPPLTPEPQPQRSAGTPPVAVPQQRARSGSGRVEERPLHRQSGHLRSHWHEIWNQQRLLAQE